MSDTVNLDEMKSHYRNYQIRWGFIWALWCAPCVAEMPALIEVVRGFDPSPRSVVEEGALYLVEARMRLPGEAVFRPRNQQLCLLSGAFTYSLPHAMGDVQVYLQRGPAREAAGQGVGTVWERELPSVRAQHIRMGLRGDDRTIGPEEIGAWQEEILSCQ